jgi:hypothetical protein
VPECPVVQPLNQVDFESKYQEKIAISMKKDFSSHSMVEKIMEQEF